MKVVGLFGRNLAYRDAARNVFWGKCRWQFAGSVSVSVSVLCRVGSGKVIARTESGMFLLSYGSGRSVECFVPGIGKCRKMTGVCRVPETPLVCVIQGNSEILV
jgi:hypothetical protein